MERPASRADRLPLDSLGEGGNHGSQAIVRPFVRLNVEIVQKLAALRYHTWYVREPGAPIRPLTDTDGSPAAGYCEAPLAFVFVARRTTEPPAQRRHFGFQSRNDVGKGHRNAAPHLWPVGWVERSETHLPLVLDFLPLCAAE